jgi:hypothetical protein
MLQPQNPQRENAVDRSLRLFFVHGDHSPRLLPLQQRAARIGRAETFFEIHRGAKCIRLPLRKTSRQYPLQHAKIFHPRCLARRRRAPVPVGDQFQSLRLRLAEALRTQTQHAVPHRRPAHSPDKIALLTPQMQGAAAMFRRQLVLRLTHVEDHLAIFEHHGTRMLGEKFFQRCCDLLYGLCGGLLRGSCSWRHSRTLSYLQSTR